ncbi:HlyD family type I secretion periplasmic adaptor subunit [Caenimonas koreensis]|uniref:Membrane fusion protein (MFP) family protein n=1 Tax=Caenimonas koreensis DSM 17982 TaxID=1121255 RepID=A0A844AT16_9BURK|nr:HlyD family type I secretion periplasmic adaptor subunit [Caenimonas koreensis]MRD47244.1 HlyD family type I secretion periplasmic adaptor subunit [Caenimonas koreensis DSM 17982]
MAKSDILSRLSSVPGNAAENAVVVKEDNELAAAAAASSDSIGAAKFGLWALGIGFGGFLLWAAFAPLDEGVPSQGMISVDTKRKPVQHPTGGLVKQVLVGEGDHVKEGQVLLRLDDARAKADFEGIRQHYMSFRASQGRLSAEQVNAPKITFHPDLLKAASDPLIRNQMVSQEQLFTSRREQLRADLQGIQESIEGQQALVNSYKGMLASRRETIKLLNEELTQSRDLVKEGYLPRNRQLELERMVSESNSAMAEVLGNIQRAERAILELRQRSISRREDYRKEVESQLTDVTQQVQADEAKFHSLQDELARVDIKAPATGQVVGLAVQTVGGVIQTGQKLMDIVPDNEPLLIETRVSPNLIDHVSAGLPVDIRFNAFSNTPTLVVEGKVVSISADLLVDQASNQQYYLARVTVTPEGYKKLGKRVLQPGMPVDVILKTGERSLLAYMLHPLTKRLAAAMKEQ